MTVEHFEETLDALIAIRPFKPFTLELRAGDEIAQIVVATLTSFPAKRKKAKGVSIGQHAVTGQSGQ